MTQKNLSELTGIHQSEISKIENGSANPSLKTLERLASAFGKKLKISFENWVREIIKSNYLVCYSYDVEYILFESMLRMTMCSRILCGMTRKN